ncbi:MAG: hypothetical protein WD314_08275 [Trueperaceae bacterium]
MTEQLIRLAPGKYALHEYLIERIHNHRWHITTAVKGLDASTESLASAVAFIEQHVERPLGAPAGSSQMSDRTDKFFGPMPTRWWWGAALIELRADDFWHLELSDVHELFPTLHEALDRARELVPVQE